MASSRTSAIVAGASRQKREQVLAACENCRTARAKCDSNRPSCSRCRHREIECIYDVEPGFTRAAAAKRKYSAQQEDLRRMQQLYELLRSGSERDAYDLLRLIRSSRDPGSVIEQLEGRTANINRTLPRPFSTEALRSFDASALRDATVKVPARPWTTVAGDGIVSHLISQFFDLEHPTIMHHIDHETFIHEMTNADASTAEYCTPLLVNAICAQGTFSSVYARAIEGTREGSLGERFFDEARKLLDNEAGRPSIPTAQALAFMYMYCSGSARDRAGLIFRLASAEMYKRLGLGSSVVPKTRSVYSEEARLRLRSRAAWGLFCQETKVCFAYYQQSLISPPEIPRHFLQTGRSDRGRGIDLDSVFDAHCSISVHLYHLSILQRKTLGYVEQLQERRHLYENINGWLNGLPPPGNYPAHIRYLHHHLRSLYYLAMILLFAPLKDIQHDIPPAIGTPTTQLATICISHAYELHSWQRMRSRDFDRGTTITTFLHYMNAFNLLTLLGNHSEVHPLFTASCRFFFNIASYWPATNAMLKGIRAFAEQTGTQLPQHCQLFMVDATVSRASGDLPISWVITNDAGIVELIGDDNADSGHVGLELGRLITRWSATSLDE